MDERDGQHSESVTKKFENVVPCWVINELNFGNRDGSVYDVRSRSSVRMKTTFGFLPDLAAGAAFGSDAAFVPVMPATMPSAAKTTISDRPTRCVLMRRVWRSPVSDLSGGRQVPMREARFLMMRTSCALCAHEVRIEEGRVARQL